MTTAAKPKTPTQAIKNVIMLPESGITAEWVMVTPDIALDWLTNKHAPNRIANDNRIKLLQSDMDKGDYLPFGSLVFDEDGYLIDGQHRLHAVVNSGKAQPYLVVRGVERRTQTVIDRGSQRSLAGDLQIAGKSNAKAMAAMIDSILAYEKSGNLIKKAGATSADRLRVQERHPTLESFVRHEAPIKGLGVGWYSAFEYLAATGSDIETIKVFREGLHTGLIPDIPGARSIITLRDRIFKHWAEPSNKMSTEIRARFLVRSWNAFYEGQDLTKLQNTMDRAPLINGCTITPIDE